MIAYIRGKLMTRSPEAAVVDVHGVGYRLLIPLTTFYKLPEEGAEVGLHAHTSVREDAITLFGFLTEAEKDLFEKLISVSKIGPRIALNILSGLPAGELRGAIARQDVVKLSSIPGVGAKTAQRLILELRDKMAVPAAGEDRQPALPPAEAKVMDDVLGALVNLGYRRKEAERVVRELWDAGERDVEPLVRKSLARLGA